MFFEDLRKRFVKQWFATQNSKEIRAHLFRIINYPINLVRIQTAVFFLSHYPASLAIQVAIVGNRNKVKGRKKFAFLLSFLKPGKRHRAFDAHIHNEFVQAFPVAPDQYVF
jgi:hypothetical protein